MATPNTATTTSSVRPDVAAHGSHGDEHRHRRRADAGRRAQPAVARRRRRRSRSSAITGSSATAPPNSTANRSSEMAASSTGVRRMKRRPSMAECRRRPLVGVGRFGLAHEPQPRAMPNQPARMSTDEPQVGDRRIDRVQEARQRRPDDDRGRPRGREQRDQLRAGHPRAPPSAASARMAGAWNARATPYTKAMTNSGHTDGRLGGRVDQQRDRAEHLAADRDDRDTSCDRSGRPRCRSPAPAASPAGTRPAR